MRLVVNNVLVDSSAPLRVPVGGTLRFDLTFEFTSTIATANYVVGAAPLWMPRENATIRLAGLPRPVHHAWQTVNFTAPPSMRPGRSRVVILMGADDSVEHLFSLTQWTVGAPRWNDGNDVHDFTVETLWELRVNGVTFVDQLQADYQGQQREVHVGSTVTRASPAQGVRVGAKELFGTVVEVEFIAPPPEHESTP